MLPNLVADVARQTYRDSAGEPSFELLVVDDRSTDGTAAAVAEAAAQEGIAEVTRLVRRDGQNLPDGKGAALTAAQPEACKGDIVVVLDATDAGAGPVSELVLAPLVGVSVNPDGATLVTVTTVVLVTLKDMVAVLPLKRQLGAAGVMGRQATVTALTVRTFELPEREVAVPVPLRTFAVKNTVPLSVPSVVHVYVMVPDAPAASVRGLGLVPVREQFAKGESQVPVLVCVGGLGFATMLLCVALDTFLTVMTTRKLAPAATAGAGRPEVSVV